MADLSTGCWQCWHTAHSIWMCRPPTGRSGTRVNNKNKREKQKKTQINKNKKKQSPREHGLLPQSVLAMVPGQQGADHHFFTFCRVTYPIAMCGMFFCRWFLLYGWEKLKTRCMVGPWSMLACFETCLRGDQATLIRGGSPRGALNSYPKSATLIWESNKSPSSLQFVH